MKTGATSAVGATRQWHHNENDVIMITAGLWIYGYWRHVATGCNAVVCLTIIWRSRWCDRCWHLVVILVSVYKFWHMIERLIGVSLSACWSLLRHERLRPDLGAFWVLDPEHTRRLSVTFKYKSVRFSIEYVYRTLQVHSIMPSQTHHLDLPSVLWLLLCKKLPVRRVMCFYARRCLLESQWLKLR